ncbi:MAG: hypothetical protein K6G83_08395 [Lachnospiraceae bacterium]|nr:hypothetical protein [Lachnospiraceae bacterium]
MPNDLYTTTNKQDGSQQLVDHKKAWENVTEVLNSAENKAEKQRAMGDFLQGIRSEVHSKKQEKETFSSYGKAYKDVYTEKQRKEQASKKGTELWHKKVNAEFIEEQEIDRQKKMRERALQAAKKSGIIGNGMPLSVKVLSSFMGTSTKANADLIKLYHGADKGQAIVSCMKQFMKLKLENLDIRSNNKVAENAAILERFSEQFSSMQYLITKNPEVYAGLPERIRLSFESYYGKASTIVSYYRLKKQVMLDSYFRTHENREISMEKSEKMTAEQQNLTEMIWQSQGGLAIFLNRSNDFILNGTLKNLKESLRQTGTGKSRLALQEKLRKRGEELEKKGLADRMDDFLIRERILDTKGKLGILGHARNLRALTLTGNPKKDLDLLPYLIDQREIIERAQDMRKDSRSSYYLEQSDIQIGMADAAINMLDTVKRLEEDLLTMGRLTSAGGIDTTVTQEKIRLCQERYERDFTEYREKMNALKAARQADYKLEEEDSPDRAEYIGPENREGNFLEEAKELIATLTFEKFSDFEIYKNRETICALAKKCKDTEASEVLDILAKRAVVVWERKRLLNVQAALNMDKDNQALKDEEKRLSDKEKLRGRHKDENGNTVEGKDDSLDGLLKLRAEAEQRLFDFNDIKAHTTHYTEQYEWALNARNEGRTFTQWLIAPLLHGFHWAYSADRNKVHGEEKYAESVERLERMPQEIMDHQAGDDLKLQRGDASVPPVDISDLFGDRMKDDLKERIAGIRLLLNGREQEYPPEIQTAVEAMEHYVKIKYIVTTDTTEMEMAFLDKFQKDLQRSFVKLRNISFEDNVIKGLLDIMTEIRDVGRGKLRDVNNPERMTDAEYAAAKDQTAVYTMYSGDDVNESNVKDLPLFLHKPHINDIKQGYIGDCYFLGAITAYMRSNPEGILNMFHDVGDGTVLVRLYMAFDENNRRVDSENDMVRPEVTMRPVYIRVRKDYDISATAQDCMWVQLLEKAYASTGTQHRVSTVDRKTGEIADLATEIAAGSADKVLMHLTGRKDCWEHNKPEPEIDHLTEADIDNRRMRMLLSGVPLWLHFDIWEAIEKNNSADLQNEEEWINSTIETVKAKVQAANDLRKVQFSSIKEDILREIPGAKEEDLNAIQKRIEEVYTRDPEAIAAQVMKNILTESPEPDDGTDLLEPSTVISRLFERFMAGQSLETMLASVGEKDTYYEPLKRGFNETNENYDARCKITDIYARDRNKAMMEMNPGGYYSREEMIFLHDVKTAKRKKEGMTFAVSMHEMSMLDVQLKNNRWYILVRDPLNLHNRVYEKDEEGNLKATVDEAINGKTGFGAKKEIRKLNGSLTSGVLGASWWELKDVFAQLVSYGNAPKIERDDNKGKLLKPLL